MPDGPQHTQEKETARVEAFSDGVFAIAITLLVLEIKVPHGIQDGERLSSQLLKLWPSLVAFFSSFATIGIMWINHHRLFTLIRKTDQRLMIMNLLLLLGVTFVPFPTALLAEHHEHWITAVIYSGTFFVIAIIFNLLWRYAASEQRLLHPEVNPEAVRAITKQYSFGPLMYLASVGLAFVHVGASVALNIALAIFFAVEPERANLWRDHMRRGHGGH